MFRRDLEFRGINRRQLEMYFEELGGRKQTDSFPIVFVGDDWEGQILSEEEIVFTSVIKVNSVKVCFFAVDEARLEELIKKYRFKTFRAGG